MYQASHAHNHVNPTQSLKLHLCRRFSLGDLISELRPAAHVAMRTVHLSVHPAPFACECANIRKGLSDMLQRQLRSCCCKNADVHLLPFKFDGSRTAFAAMQTAHLSAHPEARAAQREGRPAKLSAQRTLLYGALSGAAAELACYPLEVIRRHMQMQHLHVISGS